MIKTVKLVKPSVEYKEAFKRLVEDFRDNGEFFYSDMYQPAVDNFEEYVQTKVDHENGINIPEDWVSGQTFWLVTSEGELIGNLRIRDELKGKFLEEIGGHIGCDISPSFRDMGYGSLMLGLGIEKAKERGIRKALVSCAKNNLGSKRMIEKNGGVFENEIFKEDENQMYLRFWIDVARGNYNKK